MSIFEDPFDLSALGFDPWQTYTICISIILSGLISFICSLYLIKLCNKMNDRSMLTQFTWHQALTDAIYSIVSSSLIFFDENQICNMLTSFQLITRSLSITWAANLSLYGYTKTLEKVNFYEMHYHKILGVFYVLWIGVGIYFFFSFESSCDIFIPVTSVLELFIKYGAIIIGLIVIFFSNIKLIVYIKRLEIFTSDSKVLIWGPFGILLIWMAAFFDDSLALATDEPHFFWLWIHMGLTRSVGLVNFLIYYSRLKDKYKRLSQVTYENSVEPMLQNPKGESMTRLTSQASIDNEKLLLLSLSNG